TLEKENGGDLTMRFASSTSILDCTPKCAIQLTLGSTSSPQINYIYILATTRALTKSTSNWPTAEHIRVGFFLCSTVGYIEDEGCFINQNWNDEAMDENNQGHLLKVSERTRLLRAQYFSGIAGNGDGGTYVARTNLAPDTVFLKTTSGIVFQLHKPQAILEQLNGLTLI
ncbi:hypothetical protein LCGC14_3167180, partial [marine sediment metagenome]